MFILGTVPSSSPLSEAFVPSSSPLSEAFEDFDSEAATTENADVDVIDDPVVENVEYLQMAQEDIDPLSGIGNHDPPSPVADLHVEEALLESSEDEDDIDQYDEATGKMFHPF